MIVSGTGHRPDKLGGYSKEAFHKLTLIAEEWLRTNETDKVISGMALGWDQALAMAAIRCGIPFIAAIPFDNQGAAWPEESKVIYDKLLEYASEIVVVTPGPYLPYKMQKRNEWMVRHSDIVLAMHDGSSGGTNNCLKFAKSLRKPIVNLYPEYLNFRNVKTTVVNLKHSNADVYIGRVGLGYDHLPGGDGIFGNPFYRKDGETAESVISRYRAYFLARLKTDQAFKDAVLSLKGKRIGCFCKPYPCHGDVIAQYLNQL